MIRAAIVGLGWWGKTIVETLQGKSDRITLVAAHTRTRSAAEEYCRTKGMEFRDNLDDILRDPNIDAVVYATPHSRHEEHVKRAAQAGKHIFIEKPFTLTLASAEAAMETVRRAGVVLGIDYQRRFHPSVREIHKRITSGSLGTITCALAEVTTPSALALPKESWRTNPEETPAGAMTALGVHHVDGFIDLCGEVKEVYCANTRRAAPYVDDTTLFTMNHRNGVISTTVCCAASAASYCVAVFGTRGIAQTDRPSLDTFRFFPVAQSGGAHAVAPPEVIENKGFNPVKAALEAFADAARGEAAYPVTPEQIVHGVAVLEAIVKSARTDQPVKVA
jgi:predicted dehydrogenase